MDNKIIKHFGKNTLEEFVEELRDRIIKKITQLEEDLPTKLTDLENDLGVRRESVWYVEQSLSEEQKKQARTNIGAIGGDIDSLIIDSEIRDDSVNPVQNKVIKQYVDTIINNLKVVTSWHDLKDKPFEETNDGITYLDEKFIPESIARKTDIHTSFIIHCIKQTDDEFVVDKTFIEIMNAYNQGQTIVVQIEQDANMVHLPVLEVNNIDGFIFFACLQPIASGYKFHCARIDANDVVSIWSSVIDLSVTTFDHLLTQDKTIIGAINELSEKSVSFDFITPEDIDEICGSIVEEELSPNDIDELMSLLR